jgi:hypothetical protein
MNTPQNTRDDAGPDTPNRGPVYKGFTEEQLNVALENARLRMHLLSGGSADTDADQREDARLQVLTNSKRRMLQRESFQTIAAVRGEFRRRRTR